MSKKIAVILSGCGVYDGAEIQESVITLLRLDQRGAQVQCFAPDIPQLHVVNHLTGEEMPESRNVLVESARIARGEGLSLFPASFAAIQRQGVVFRPLEEAALCLQCGLVMLPENAARLGWLIDVIQADSRVTN